MNGDTRVHMKISGMVQGVFFRANTKRQAQALGIYGWVRNLTDGRVEIVAQGPREALAELIRWCQEGPSTARVDRVDIDWEPVEAGLAGFAIRDR